MSGLRRPSPQEGEAGKRRGLGDLLERLRQEDARGRGESGAGRQIEADACRIREIGGAVGNAEDE